METVAPRPNPYVGPRAFQTGERLYGRARETERLFNLLLAERIVLCYAPSGAGKTSLLQAALIPRLREEGYQVLPVMRVNQPLPAGAAEGNRYVFSALNVLETERAAELHRPPEELAQMTLADYLAGLQLAPETAASADCVLLFDQFEELLTADPADADAKAAFFDQAGAVLRDRRYWAVFALREDYLAALEPYLSRVPTRLKTTSRLELLGVEAAREAVQSPAREAGVDFKDSAAYRLVNDLRRVKVQCPDGSFETRDGPYVEPVQLQVVCRRLWASHAPDDGTITEEEITALGDVSRALGDYYAEQTSRVAETLKVPERSIREWFDRKLIVEPGVRSQVLMGAKQSEGLGNTAIHALENAHLVRADKRGNATWFELAHDRLVEPVRENNRAWFEQHLSLLQKQAAVWVQQGRTEGLLLRGQTLQEARKQANALALTADERAFLEASRRLEAQAQWRRRAVGGLIVLFILVVGLLLFALAQLNISRAMLLGAQAQVAYQTQNYNNAALYAYQSNRISQNAAADWVLGRLPYENFATVKELVGHTGAVNSVAWSADDRLASGSSDGTVIVWDRVTGRPAHILKVGSNVETVAWSADGSLASGSADGTVIVWDLATGRPAQTLNGHTSTVHSVAWSADGRLASGSVDGTIIIWDRATGLPAQILKPGSDVESVAWSADGRLASGSYDRTVSVWDLVTGKPLQTLRGHTDIVTSVAWSADGRLASGSADDTVILWDLDTGRPAQTMKEYMAAGVTSVAWSADGRLASGSTTVIVWDLATGRPAQTLKEQEAWITSVAWSADGRLASAFHDNNTLLVWDLATGRPAQTLENISYVQSLAWSADGRVASGSFDGTVILWNLMTGQPAQTLMGHTGAVNSVAWSAGGRLASGSDDKTVIVWDLATGQPAQTLKGHRGAVRSVAWSADGRLASGSFDRAVIIWDLAKGRPAQTLWGHTDYVWSVAWSADGRLASSSVDHTVIIWDLATGKPAQTLKGHTNSVTSVAWSADGRLASGSADGTVIVWDLAAGRPAQTLEHTNSVMSVAWSADGRLASGSFDGTVIVWDLATGRRAQTLKGHTSYVNSVAWSADNRLASGSEDRTVKIARADLIRGKPCDWIYRNMTIQEWLDYQGVFYVYEPTCPNLPVPAQLAPVFPASLLISWEGRAILLGTAVVLVAILVGLGWAAGQAARWEWRQVSRRLRHR